MFEADSCDASSRTFWNVPKEISDPEQNLEVKHKFECKIQCSL